VTQDDPRGTAAAPPIVEIEGVRKTFGTTVALDSVTLSVARGEMFALLGASGSGKTTLLRLLAGFDEPDAGRILIDGRDMRSVAPYERPVNMMFQSYALFPHMNVGANVAFGLRQQAGENRLSKEEIRERARAALSLVRLEGFDSRRPHELSGGQQQRVALARAIVKRPKLLLLDEPLAALDRKLRQSTQLELVRIQAETGITFVIVTHDQEEAMSLSDRMAVLHAGRVAQIGPPKEIYENPTNVYVADFIGNVNLLHGKVTALDGERASVDCTELGCALAVAIVPPGVRVGDTLHVAVRPERVSVSRGDAGTAGAGANTVRGRVRDVAYLGAHSRLTAEVAGGKLMTAVRLNPGDEPETLAPGAEVSLVFAAGDCRGLAT
jgi:putrescine transport system ATP-binding protein